MSNTIQNDIINPVANVLGTPLMNILIDKLYQKAPKQKQTGPAKKAKQNVYEEAPLDEEFVVLKDIVLEDDFVTASDEAEFPPFKKAEKFKYAPDQKSIDEIVKLFHQNKAPSANYDGECANSLPTIFNLQDYFVNEYDPKQLGTLSAVTGRPVHLYKDGIKIGEANNIRSSVMRPIEINYNTDTRMYHSVGDGLSFYGRETIIDVALQDQAIFASYGTQTNLQDAMNSFQNTYPFSFTDQLSYEEFLQTLRKKAQPTYNLKDIIHSDYTEALYGLYLNGRPLADIHVNELEAYTHLWAKKIQTIKEFSKGNLPMTTSVVNALFKTAEKVMDSVGVLVKELLINPTEDYLEATDPKTNAEIKKYLKDITGEIKYWFDGLTPAVQEIIKDGFKVADVAGTAGLVKGAIQGAKAGIVAETKAAATPTLLSKTKLLRAVEDLKNRLDNIVPPFEFATVEGISLNKIPKNTCPNPKIKNPNTLFNMGEGIDTKIKTNVGTKSTKTKLGKHLEDSFNKNIDILNAEKKYMKAGWEKMENGKWHHSEAGNMHDIIPNRPYATDSKMKSIYEQLYRSSDVIPGGTAEMLKEEISQGAALKHLKKAKHRLSEITKRILDTNNPMLRSELKTAERMQQILRDIINIAEEV